VGREACPSARTEKRSLHLSVLPLTLVRIARRSPKTTHGLFVFYILRAIHHGNNFPHGANRTDSHTLGYVFEVALRRISSRTKPQSELCSRPFGPPSARTPKSSCTFTVTAMLCDIMATRNEKGRAPYSGAYHPMEEVVTEHRGGALGEKEREQGGAQSVQNFSGMNESCDSRSNIRTVLFRSTPCRTKSRPKIHNRRTSPLPPCHSASPCL
jgi:hypothetical protein